MRGINIMRRLVSTTHRASSSVETLKFHGGQRIFFPAGRYSRSSSSENLSRSPFLRGRSTEICEIGNFFFFHHCDSIDSPKIVDKSTPFPLKFSRSRRNLTTCGFTL